MLTILAFLFHSKTLYHRSVPFVFFTPATYFENYVYFLHCLDVYSVRTAIDEFYSARSLEDKSFIQVDAALTDT